VNPVLFNRQKTQLVDPDAALPGRAEAVPLTAPHHVLGTPLRPPYPDGLEVAVVGMGCFWGAERIFWQLDGVHSTSVGYAGGYTPNPTYEEVCSARTGHTEVVQIVFDPARVTYAELLKVFWENHDPTQGMRQGNDVGTQYRSAIYTTSEEQASIAKETREAFAPSLRKAGYGDISTEIVALDAYYFAEDYHQQYLDKNPNGYCTHGFNGVTCPVGLNVPAQVDVLPPG